MILIGLNIRHREFLPKSGPAVIIANHNSHLDTMVLITMLGINLLSQTRPVAAADYFLRNPVLAWFAINIIGIIPVQRAGKGGGHPLQGAFDAIDNEKILIIFPEGSRGEPETLSSLKRGVGHIAKKYPDVPIIPVYLYGLGKALPKGEALLVPFFCDVVVGESLYGEDDIQAFMTNVSNRFATLHAEVGPREWR